MDYFKTALKVFGRKKVIDESALSESRLARVLNTFDLTALGVGSTLGVGVYVLAGQIARDTAGPSVVISFLLAAIASVFAGLCYAEFGARTPRAGSAYVYSYVCVGEFVAFVIGWNLILEYVIGSASVARALSSYLDTLLNNTIQDAFTDIVPMHVSFLAPYFDFLAFGISFLLAVGLAFGLKESSLVNNIFTLLNVAVVLFVIIAGSIKANLDNWKLPGNSTEEIGEGGFFPFGIEGTIKGAATCFYGFVGFDAIATTGEEVNNPQKAIPLSIIFSLAIIFMAYFGTSTVITLMVPYYLQDRDAPIPTAFENVGWDFAKWIVAIGGIFGLCASLFGAMLPLPRVIYAMANDGLVFRFLGYVSQRFQTPVVGTILAGFLTGIMAALFNLKQLVDMMSIGTLLAYTIVAACVLLLRYVENQDAVNEDPNISPADNDISILKMTKSFFNSGRHENPTPVSEKLVAIEIVLYCILCLLLGLCGSFLIDPIRHGKAWAIAITAIVGCLVVLVLMSLTLQPTSRERLTFKVPLVPLIPGLSILCNIYLMLMLDVQTWIRFGVWMLLGLPLYFISIWLYPKPALESTLKNSLPINAKPHPNNGHIPGNGKTNGHINQAYCNDAEKESGFDENAKESESEIQISEEHDLDLNPIPAVSVVERDNENVPPVEFDLALAALDDVLCSDYDSLSIASNSDVHNEESVVAQIHREDTRSAPVTPQSEKTYVYPTIDRPQNENVSLHTDNEDENVDQNSIIEIIPSPPPLPFSSLFENVIVPKIPRVPMDSDLISAKMKLRKLETVDIPPVDYFESSIEDNLVFGSKQHDDFKSRLENIMRFNPISPVTRTPSGNIARSGGKVKSDFIIADRISTENAKKVIGEFLAKDQRTPVTRIPPTVESDIKVDDFKDISTSHSVNSASPSSEHRLKMANTLSSIRLRKVESFKEQTENSR